MRSEYEQTNFSQSAAPPALLQSSEIAGLPATAKCGDGRSCRRATMATAAIAAGGRPWRRRLVMRMRHRSPDVLTPAGFYR